MDDFERRERGISYTTKVVPKFSGNVGNADKPYFVVGSKKKKHYLGYNRRYIQGLDPQILGAPKFNMQWFFNIYFNCMYLYINF